VEKCKFKAVLLRPEGQGTWTYLDIPFSVVDAYGGKGQVRVKGTINGHPFQSSAMPHGNGTHYLVVSRAIRDAIGATQGDVVNVLMEADARIRSVPIPADLKRALGKNGKAKTAFESLSYSHKKEYVEWIENAKKPETRTRRVARSLEMLVQNLTPKRSKS
jgi:hypothetical protein